MSVIKYLKFLCFVKKLSGIVQIQSSGIISNCKSLFQFEIREWNTSWLILYIKFLKTPQIEHRIFNQYCPVYEEKQRIRNWNFILQYEK